MNGSAAAQATSSMIPVGHSDFDNAGFAGEPKEIVEFRSHFGTKLPSHTRPACRSQVTAATAMADLPRWIDDETVDSSAMCVGYIDWVRGERSNGRGPELLPEILHTPYLLVDNASGVNLPWLPCAKVACGRCMAGKGGYQFRWYSHKWHEVYMTHRRPGAWVARTGVE